MKNWSKVYTKYKDTKLMKGFIKYFLGFNIPKFNFDYGSGIGSFDIKDIFGYLLCFAETKGYGITLDIQSDVTSPSAKILVLISVIGGETSIITQGFESGEIEQAMIWCADKFFEVSRET